ncbi:MAG: porin family protein [Rhizobiaceae bacterium]|nr:porin family protein [Rhizobiaceae bacterium]
MHIRSLILALAATVAAAPSLAADFAEEAPAESSWTAVYIGVVGGYFASAMTQSGCVGLCPVAPRYDSWGLGLQIGADHQLPNNFVVGAYGRVMLASRDVAVPIFPAGSTVPFPGGTFTADPKFAGAIGARVGYSYGSFLPYAAVGYTGAKITASNALFGTSYTATHHGVHVSAGVEAKLTEHISADFRYTYTHFAKATYDFGGGTSQYGANANNFTLALNYRF